MIDKEIIGGVSPLKARQSSRGGKNAARATSTGKRRGGFAKSKGKRGGGGRNVGGYNVQTRFTPPAGFAPRGSGGTTIVPTKPYSFDPEGKMQVEPPADVGGDGVEKRTIPAEEGKKGNEFADNCYGPNGEKLQGKSYYSEKKGMNILCDWKKGAKDDGSFSYDKKGTDAYDEQRTYQKDSDGEIIASSYSEWERVNNK